MGGLHLMAMEYTDASKLISYECMHYGRHKNVAHKAICTNLLDATDQFENIFYGVYKKNLKTVTYGQHPALSFVCEATTNPFYGTVDLWETIPSSKNLAGNRSWCGVIETDRLNPRLIQDNLNRFTCTTNTMAKLLKGDQKKLEEYITIRSGTLRFFDLRVRKYHEEQISNIDIMVPITCSTCGSTNCSAAGLSCAAGQPCLASIFCGLGAIEQLVSYAWIYMLATNKKVRSQHFCITESDVKTISAIKLAVKKAREDTLNLEQ